MPNAIARNPDKKVLSPTLNPDPQTLNPDPQTLRSFQKWHLSHWHLVRSISVTQGSIKHVIMKFLKTKILLKLKTEKCYKNISPQKYLFIMPKVR